MYLNELVDDFVFGTNHGFNLIVCKPLSYTYTSSWLWGWKELYKLQTQKSVYAMHSTILRSLFDLQKCAKNPPKTKQKQSSICILTLLKVGQFMRNSNLEVYGTTDERTNEGGGGGHSTYSCLLPPQTTRGPEYSISYNNSAPGNSVCRYRYDP